MSYPNEFHVCPPSESSSDRQRRHPDSCHACVDGMHGMGLKEGVMCSCPCHAPYNRDKYYRPGLALVPPKAEEDGRIDWGKVAGLVGMALFSVVMWGAVIMLVKWVIGEVASGGGL